MGKHETGFARVDKDYYRTPSWVIDALAEHVGIAGSAIWEPAAGDGQMVEALKAAGAASVWASDIVQRGCSLDGVLDFPTGPAPDLHLDLIVTNPPFGSRGRLAVAFIETGLRHIVSGRARGLALLLPTDFDSAASRTGLFRDCACFAAKLVLTKRIVWFQRPDGTRESPKENHCWALWGQPLLRAADRSPIVLYAPNSAGGRHAAP
jgi:hypothetical protein